MLENVANVCCGNPVFNQVKKIASACSFDLHGEFIIMKFK